MQGKSDAATHEEYIQRLAEPRRSDVRALHELIRRAAPQLEPTMEFGMLGYGNKNYVSLYVTAEAPGGGYLAESYREQLPKASIGKSCVRFKRLRDVDQAALERLLRAAVEAGFPGA